MAQNRYTLGLIGALLIIVCIEGGFLVFGSERIFSKFQQVFGVSKGYVVPVETLASDPITNDPLSKYQWGLRMLLDGATYHDIQKDASRDTTIAVIDHRWGPLDHPDLINKVIDGWNFFENRKEIRQTYDGRSPNRSIAHGQCAASIIAAEVDNGVGIAGVFKRAYIMPLQSDLDQIAEAIAFAVTHQADVIFIAGGFIRNKNRWPAFLWPMIAQKNLRPKEELYTEPNLQLMGKIKRALHNAYKANIPVVTGVGNSGKFTLGFVADDPRVIAVGAHNVLGEVSNNLGFSYSFEVFGPGGSWKKLRNVQEIKAAFQTSEQLGIFPLYGDYDDPICAIGEKGYSFLTLNSASIPHVVGVIAFIKSYLPHSNVQEVRDILYQGQIPLNASGSLLEGVGGRISLRLIKQEINRRLHP